MTLLELIKTLKLDFTKCVIEPDYGSVLDYQFEISPKDFLNFGKSDFRSNDKRGNINALTNAKRAIDCQTDKIFYSIGLDPENFPKIISDFIANSSNSPQKKDLPIKLRFLQSMNFAPAEIISNSRNFRNKLEHFYKNPSIEEVSNAIELAELFILATDSKLKSLWAYLMSDKEKHVNGRLANSIYITYDDKKNRFEIQGYLGDKKLREILIDNSSIEFYYLLKIATSFDYNEDVQQSVIELIEQIGHPLPRKHIRIEIE